MPQDNKVSNEIIQVELIRETVMPPYPYQEYQNGFGSAGSALDEEIKDVPDKPLTLKDSPKTS